MLNTSTLFSNFNKILLYVEKKNRFLYLKIELDKQI